MRNPYYWKVDPEGRQLPYIDRITFDIYDLETINIKAINGEIGMQGRHLTFQNYPIFMANQKGIQRAPLARWWRRHDGDRIQFEPQRRGAASYLSPALLSHRDVSCHRSRRHPRSRFSWRGRVATDLPAPISAYHVPEHAYGYLTYDPGLANRLLDEMGLVERDDRGMRLRPDGQPLVIHIETSSTMLGAGKMFEMIAANWRDVGIDAKVKTQARQLYAQRRNALLCDVLVWGGAGEIVPTLDPRWFLPYSGSSFHGLDYAR